MKTDRELLELAAKAAGYSVDCGFSDCPLIFGEDAGPDGPREWSPLTDDGDALRLAVKLGISIVCMEDVDSVGAEHSGHGVMIIEALYDYGVRRAIVRAAAAIGDSMND